MAGKNIPLKKDVVAILKPWYEKHGRQNVGWKTRGFKLDGMHKP